MTGIANTFMSGMSEGAVDMTVIRAGDQRDPVSDTTKPLDWDNPVTEMVVHGVLVFPVASQDAPQAAEATRWQTAVDVYLHPGTPVPHGTRVTFSGGRWPGQWVPEGEPVTWDDGEWRPVAVLRARAAKTSTV